MILAAQVTSKLALLLRRCRFEGDQKFKGSKFASTKQMHSPKRRPDWLRGPGPGMSTIFSSSIKGLQKETQQ